MLDFPELLLPARIVSGRSLISCSENRDLNPQTDIDVNFPLKSDFVVFAVGLAIVLLGRQC